MATAALVLVSGLLLGGCGGEEKPAAQHPPSPTVSPTPGGPTPTAIVPSGALDDLERPVAKSMRQQVATQGLELGFLDCPDWDGKVPQKLTCTGWFDKVPGEVTVKLTKDESGGVAFDAVLGDGVVATAKLVAELGRQGFTEVDCGSQAAYPSDAGLQIICSVTKEDSRQFVVATVQDGSGRLKIEAYPAS